MYICTVHVDVYSTYTNLHEKSVWVGCSVPHSIHDYWMHEICSFYINFFQHAQVVGMHVWTHTYYGMTGMYEDIHSGLACVHS